jgi:hypothetical protein
MKWLDRIIIITSTVFFRVSYLFAFSAFGFCEISAFDLFFIIDGYKGIVIGVNDAFHTCTVAVFTEWHINKIMDFVYIIYSDKML